MHRYLKLVEVAAELHVDPELLEKLEAEDVIHPKHTLENEPIISPADAERLRLVLSLMRDLDVNLAGVEVILHMRESILEMQRQFVEIIDALAAETRQRERQG